MPDGTLLPWDDARLAPYRNMKDRDLARTGDRFIAEGEQVVRRLITSGFGIESLLVTQRKAAEIAPLAPPGVPVLVAEDSVIKRVIGFKFHGGALACGIRPKPLSLQQALPIDRPNLTVVICQEIANTENLGSLIRIAAAFGVDAMLLNEHCCDPFFRQSVRVSMGAVFKLPIVQSQNLLADMCLLRQRWGFSLAATVLSPRAEPLTSVNRTKRFGIVFGNEAQGLDAQTVAACDRQITIPMRLGTDSLNVAVAAGVFLFHFTRENEPPADRR